MRRSVRSIVEDLLARLNTPVTFEPGTDESLHSHKQAAIVIEGNKAGVVGQIHPKVLENFDISEDVYLIEINLAALLPYTAVHPMFQPIPRFPAMVRDMALVIDAEVTHKKITGIIESFPLVTEVSIFDVYSGKQVPEGKKSLAYRITFQSPDHTLTDKEVNKVEKQILDRLFKDLNATLRE